MQRHLPKLRQPAPSHLLSHHLPKMRKQKQQQQQLRSRSDETRTTGHHRHRRPIPPPLTHVQSNQSIAYFAYPVPLSIQPTCSFHSQYRRPLPMSSASEMVGYTFRRKWRCRTMPSTLTPAVIHSTRFSRSSPALVKTLFAPAAFPLLSSFITILLPSFVCSPSLLQLWYRK